MNPWVIVGDRGVFGKRRLKTLKPKHVGCGHKMEQEAAARYQYQKLDTELLVSAAVPAIAAAGPHWHPEEMCDFAESAREEEEEEEEESIA